MHRIGKQGCKNNITMEGKEFGAFCLSYALIDGTELCIVTLSGKGLPVFIILVQWHD